MLIIKLWGSIFAPKDNNNFDEKYLEKLNKSLSKVYHWNIILIHWTWNIWHWFVKKFWINKRTFWDYLKVKNNFFWKIDNIFSGYKRVLARNAIKVWKSLLHENKNIIIWWDALKNTFQIISSDILFWKLLWEKDNIEIILTNIDWVIDNKWEIIKEINLQELNKIDFWENENDVTGSMKWKLEAIKENLPKNSKWVWLCNWKKIENIEKIIKYWEGIWTLLVNK